MRKTTHILLLIVSLLVLLTGYGITQYQIIEKSTFGLLSKSLSFYLHDKLAILFVILLILHLIYTLSKK